MDLLLIVSLVLFLGSPFIMLIRPLKELRAPIMNLVLFMGTSMLLWFGAAPFFEWAARFFALPILIITHWGELTPETKQTIILLLVGLTFSLTSIIAHFRIFVYRSIFPDFLREDEKGHRVAFGRLYVVKKKEDGWHVWWRYNGFRSPPWKFHHIVSPVKPHPVGHFKTAILAARFDKIGEREWRAISTTDANAVIPTTRINAQDFLAWEVEDLERKKGIARDGAQGHLLTQRHKSLNNRMDTTILRAGRLNPHRGKERFTERRASPKTDVERLTVMVKEGSQGIHEESAPSSVDDGGPRV